MKTNTSSKVIALFFMTLLGSCSVFQWEKDVIQNGIPCSNSIFFPVSFYENGHLKSCKLSAAINHDGKNFKKGTKILVSPDGIISKLAP